MFFLIRAAFWICVVLLVMPSRLETRRRLADKVAIAKVLRPTSVAQVVAAKPASSARKAVEKAKATKPASPDVAEYGAKAAAYCLRKPDVCRSGAAAADGIGERLSKGLAVISALVVDASSPATTGSIAREGD